MEVELKNLEEARTIACVLAEAAREPVAVLAGEGHTVCATNAAFRRVFNLAEGEAEGRAVSELGGAGWDGARLRTLLEEVFARGAEFEGCEVGGAVVVRARPLGVKVTGRPLIMLGVEGSAEQGCVGDALRASEERYRAFVANSSEAIWRFEMGEPLPTSLSEDEQIEHFYQHGYLAECNDAMARMYGLERAADIVGARPADLLPPELPQSHEFLRAFIRSKYLLTEAETVERTADGELRRFINNMTGIVEDGLVRRVWGTQRDVTERRRAEAELAEANLRAITEYERLLDRIAALAQGFGGARDLQTIYHALGEFARRSMPSDAVLVLLDDSRAGTHMVVYSCSGGVKETGGQPPSTRLTRGPHGRAVASGQVVIEDALQAEDVSATADTDEAERDGPQPRSALIVPMMVMGRVIGAVEVQSVEPAAYRREHATAMRMAANLAGVAIENVRLLEQELDNAERLRLAAKMEAVGRLAGGIAHDFNNLLTAINGYSELTLRRVEPHGLIHRNLEEIRKAGERAAALTRQLLAFSRKQVLQPRVLNLNTVVGDMEKMLYRLIGEDVELRVTTEPALSNIKADPGQIEQVLMNLAVNARDAMPRGGRLTIETRDVFLDEKYASRHVAVRPGNYVMLSVSDNGSGMTADVLPRIFDPFFTTKEQGRGTGLGLSTVYGIVKQSGGNIWAYSEPGRGTSFKIYLPVVAEGAETLRRAYPEGAPCGNETVLVVEDEEVVRRMTREILETNGYRVLTAGGGGEAVRICEGQPETIHLLLTDVVMPQVSGKELADALAFVRPGMRVLFMSGYTDEAIVHHGVLDEGVPFIQKPFTPAALARKIREVLDAPVAAVSG